MFIAVEQWPTLPPCAARAAARLHSRLPSTRPNLGTPALPARRNPNIVVSPYAAPAPQAMHGGGYPPQQPPPVSAWLAGALSSVGSGPGLGRRRVWWTGQQQRAITTHPVVLGVERLLAGCRCGRWANGS